MHLSTPSAPFHGTLRRGSLWPCAPHLFSLPNLWFMCPLAAFFLPLEYKLLEGRDFCMLLHYSIPSSR